MSRHLLALWLVFAISYTEFQRAVNSLTGEMVVYRATGAGRYTLYLLHERIAGHVVTTDAIGSDATDFEVWKSTATPLTSVGE